MSVSIEFDRLELPFLFWLQGDKLLEAVARMKLPTIVAISRNDRLLSYSLFLEVCAVLGASEGDMWHFDGEGRMLRSGELYAL